MKSNAPGKTVLERHCLRTLAERPRRCRGPLRVRGDNWGFTDLFWKNGAVFLCASRYDFMGVLVENWTQVDPEAVKALLEKPR